MRRRKMTKRLNKEASVDMTPMLDIIFILLIFFIVTTSFVKEKGFIVKKAEESQSSDNTSKIIAVHVDANNTVFFNNQIIDIDRLPARIEYFIANNPTDKILVRPNKNTNYQQVVDILDKIKPFKQLKISIGIYRP